MLRELLLPLASFELTIASMIVLYKSRQKAQLAEGGHST